MRTPSSHEHHFECRLTWTGASRGGTTSYDAYSRDLLVEVEGKPPLVGSSAPAFRGDAKAHNPEDLLVAALAECHCLSYLALATRAGIVVVGYDDRATGTLAKIDGKFRFREVTLRPRVRLAPGASVDRARALHEQAHAECFIANSVNFPVRNEPEISGE
ncbi:MAG TPA: OsmC family protein [Polyangiaceae bacterium]|jgi:organic hydroperoxide reductase OsmC/OhrA|nr:OsmC family protein [Polyangiaceae bacterium]